MRIISSRVIRAAYNVAGLAFGWPAKRDGAFIIEKIYLYAAKEFVYNALVRHY